MPSNLEESATEGHYIYHGKPRKTTKGHGRSRQATGGHGRSRDTMGHHVKPLYLTRNHRSMLSLGSILGPPTDQSFCGRPCVTYCNQESLRRPQTDALGGENASGFIHIGAQHCSEPMRLRFCSKNAPLAEVIAQVPTVANKAYTLGFAYIPSTASVVLNVRQRNPHRRVIWVDSQTR